MEVTKQRGGTKVSQTFITNKNCPMSRQTIKRFIDELHEQLAETPKIRVIRRIQIKSDLNFWLALYQGNLK